MSSFLYYNDKNILCLNKIIVNKQTKKQKQEKKTKQTKRQKMKTIKTEKNEHQKEKINKIKNYNILSKKRNAKFTSNFQHHFKYRNKHYIILKFGTPVVQTLKFIRMSQCMTLKSIAFR